MYAIPTGTELQKNNIATINLIRIGLTPIDSATPPHTPHRTLSFDFLIVSYLKKVVVKAS